MIVWNASQTTNAASSAPAPTAVRCIGWAPPRYFNASQDLVDPVNRSVRASLTDTDGDDPIQECVSLRRGFESRKRAKVVGCGIDHLSAAERGNCIGRAMAQPLKPHVDQRPVVGLERDPQVELQNTVGAQQQPVTSPGQNSAAEPRALEVAS